MQKVNYSNVLKLHQENKNNALIAKIIGASVESVRQYLKKQNLHSNFKYSDRYLVKKEELQILIDKKLKDSEISKILNIPEITIYQSRKRWGIERDSFIFNKPIHIGKKEMSILKGTLLGDSSLILPKDCINPHFRCEHGYIQKDYIYYKYENLSNLDLKIIYYKRNKKDLRTDKIYHAYSMSSKSNSEYLKLYNILYKNNKKIVSEEFLKGFDAQSLAYLFMDDGAKLGYSISIATNGFDERSKDILIEYLFHTFKLEFSKHKNGVIYLKSKCYYDFCNLIFPYLHKSMYYKIDSFLKKVS